MTCRVSTRADVLLFSGRLIRGTSPRRKTWSCLSGLSSVAMSSHCWRNALPRSCMTRTRNVRERLFLKFHAMDLCMPTFEVTAFPGTLVWVVEYMVMCTTTSCSCMQLVQEKCNPVWIERQVCCSTQPDWRKGVENIYSRYDILLCCHKHSAQPASWKVSFLNPVGKKIDCLFEFKNCPVPPDVMNGWCSNRPGN